MAIPFKLDDVIDKVLREDTPERQMIQAFAGVNLSNREAQSAWHRVPRCRRRFFYNIYIPGGKNSGSRLTNWIRRAPGNAKSCLKSF